MSHKIRNQKLCLEKYQEKIDIKRIYILDHRIHGMKMKENYLYGIWFVLLNIIKINKKTFK